jgi:alpha-ketoglutarate-dependent taurine dioxygenase
MISTTDSPSQKPKMKRMGIPRRRAVTVSSESMVKTGSLTPGESLPLVIEPSDGRLDPIAWAESKRPFIRQRLLEHGAILFRDFGLTSVDTFMRFAGVLIPRLANYVEGSSPRISVGTKVYTSTEYPADQFVSMHNELSYAHKWPSRILFYCDTAPAEGGETPIADSRKVLDLLSARTKARFVEKGTRYIRNLHGGKGAGLSWQTVFETTDRAWVEDYCREGEIEFRWEENGGLWTRQDRPAVRAHPETGDRVWFNQVDQWHPSNLGKDIAEALVKTTPVEELPIYATFGDGSPFEEAELDEIRDAFQQAIVKFPWRKGDALLVDNMLVAHGRMPFAGPRKILVVMGDE